MTVKSKFGDMEFIFEKEQDFEGCVLLNGWHGIGECGFISLSHLVENLDAERIGFIITENIPQFITIKNEKITFPFEIYRKDDVVVILPIFEPIKSDHLRFTKTIVEWSIQENFKYSILIGGSIFEGLFGPFWGGCSKKIGGVEVPLHNNWPGICF